MPTHSRQELHTGILLLLHVDLVASCFEESYGGKNALVNSAMTLNAILVARIKTVQSATSNSVTWGALVHVAATMQRRSSMSAFAHREKGPSLQDTPLCVVNHPPPIPKNESISWLTFSLWFLLSSPLLLLLLLLLLLSLQLLLLSLMLLLLFLGCCHYHYYD